MKISSVRFICSGTTKNHYPPPIFLEIAVFGRSNAGKSSLINNLVGRHNLAAVSQNPGRTKALNFYLVNENLYLADLPGYGYAKVSVDMRKGWGRMVENYFRQRENLALILFLSDIRRTLDDEERAWCEFFHSLAKPFIYVLTKADLFKISERTARLKEVKALGHEHMLDVIDFSIREARSKKTLWAAISKFLQESP